MKLLKNFKFFEANENLKSRADLDKCWHNAKIGDIIEEHYIYNYVQYLHDDYDGAFSDGDLGDRIENYDRYKLSEVLISEIDTEEFETSNHLIKKYKERLKIDTNYPPIIIEKIGYPSKYKYGIIDGTHRAISVGKTQEKIKAWIGV
jgi:hypothetical protein